MSVFTKSSDCYLFSWGIFELSLLLCDKDRGIFERIFFSTDWNKMFWSVHCYYPSKQLFRTENIQFSNRRRHFVFSVLKMRMTRQRYCKSASTLKTENVWTSSRLASQRWWIWIALAAMFFFYYFSDTRWSFHISQNQRAGLLRQKLEFYVNWTHFSKKVPFSVLIQAIRHFHYFSWKAKKSKSLSIGQKNSEKL